MLFLFDNLNWLYYTAVIAELFALAFFFISQRQHRYLALLIGPVIALAAWTLDYSVETDREQIIAVTKKIVAASVTPDTGAMIGTLHNELMISNLDLDQVANIIVKYIKRKPFSSNYIKSIDVTSTDPQDASAEFTAITIFDQQGDFAAAGMTTSKWLFNFRKDSKGRFKIINMTMLSLNNSNPIDIFHHPPNTLK